MSDSVQLLKIYNVGFWICLTLAVLFLIISVILFVKFDIKGIWSLKSGRAQAKAIREKQSEAAKSGKMRTGKKNAPELMASGELETERQTTMRPPGRSAEYVQDTAQKNAEQGFGQMLVQNEISQVSVQQIVQTPSEQLRDGTGLTTALAPEEMKTGHGKFLLEKQIIYIHTEEKI